MTDHVIREAVAAFPDSSRLEVAADEPLLHGFDRSQLSLMAMSETVWRQWGAPPDARRPRGKWDIHEIQNGSKVTHVTLHAVVSARVTLGARQLEQPARLSRSRVGRLLLSLHQAIEPGDELTQPRLRLSPTLAIKLGHDPRIASTVFREFHRSRTIWRIGL